MYRRRRRCGDKVRWDLLLQHPTRAVSCHGRAGGTRARLGSLLAHTKLRSSCSCPCGEQHGLLRCQRGSQVLLSLSKQPLRHQHLCSELGCQSCAHLDTVHTVVLSQALGESAATWAHGAEESASVSLLCFFSAESDCSPSLPLRAVPAPLCQASSTLITKLSSKKLKATLSPVSPSSPPNPWQIPIFIKICFKVHLAFSNLPVPPLGFLEYCSSPLSSLSAFLPFPSPYPSSQGLPVSLAHAVPKSKEEGGPKLRYHTVTITGYSYLEGAHQDHEVIIPLLDKLPAGGSNSQPWCYLHHAPTNWG